MKGKQLLPWLFGLIWGIPGPVNCQTTSDGPAAASIEARGLSDKLLDRIDKRTASVDQQLDRQTDAYLSRLARWEAKIKRRLTAVDSAQAARLFSNDPNQVYATLAKGVTNVTSKPVTSMGPEYLPYADSLQGILGFLNKYPSLLGSNPTLQNKIAGSLAQWQQLQAKLQSADQIKQFVQSRKIEIEHALAQYAHLPPGINSALDGFKRQAYYYSDQVHAYREMLNDPDKIFRRALAILNKVPAFTNFMKQNGFLAGLFSVPGAYDQPQGVDGLQTRDQVLALIQNQVGQGGASGAAAIQNSLSAASQDIGRIQNKLSSLGGGSGDMDMPNFKPNNQRNKSFLHRLELGTYFQTTPATSVYPTYSDIGLTVGYKLGHGNSIGIGGSYKIGWGTPLQHVSVSSEGVGLRSYLDIHLKKSFSLTGGLEANYLTPFRRFQDVPSVNRWTSSGLIGISKQISMKSRLFKKTQVSFLWDFLSYYHQPKTPSVVFRVGYAL